MSVARIEKFEGVYRWFSNFWMDEFGFCVEIEYQAQKHANPAMRSLLRLKLEDGDRGEAAGSADSSAWRLVR